MRAGDPVADDAGARPDLPRAAAGGRHRNRSAAQPELADRVAADGGPGCWLDRAVRRGLYRIPTSGSARLGAPHDANKKGRPHGRPFCFRGCVYAASTATMRSVPGSTTTI